MTARSASLRNAHRKVLTRSVAVAVALHAMAFAVWPEYAPRFWWASKEGAEAVQMVVVDVVPIPEKAEEPKSTLPSPSATGLENPGIPVEVGLDDALGDEAAIPPLDMGLNGQPPPPPDCESNGLVAQSAYPVATHIVKPEYPEPALAENVEGSVRVRVRVSESGIVVAARVIESTADVFNRATVEAASKWQFKPARQREHPVACTVEIPFRFTLRPRRQPRPLGSQILRESLS